jgi:hypothetical protein
MIRRFPQVTRRPSRFTTSHPELDIDFVNYPGAVPSQIHGQVNEICVAICGPDRQTVTINWGDGTSSVLTGITLMSRSIQSPATNMLEQAGTYDYRFCRG